MIGKLSNWRGDHRSKDWRHSGVGGLVSIEDLSKKSKTSPPNKPPKKKVPFLSLGRQSVTLKSLQAEDEDGFSNGEGPLAADIDLFSNIPASAGFAPSLPRSSTSGPPSPSRPKTADPDRASFARRRSKTTPAGDAPLLTLDWAETPLPLTLDFEHVRQLSVSTTHSARPGHDNGFATASVPRPRTSQSMESGPSVQGSRKRSASTASKASKPTYSLTPAISPVQSRRPSLSGADIQKIAQVAMAKSTSNASHGSPARPRSNSRTSVTNAAPLPQPAAHPAPIPAAVPTPAATPDRGILDEVGGTLSATIRELQDLQGDWDNTAIYRPMRTSSLMYKAPYVHDAARSTPSIQEDYPERSRSHNATPASAASAEQQSGGFEPSLPPTPRSASLPKSETPSLGRMQSIQIAYEKSKTAAHRLGVENDTLKQQLKFLRERLAEMGEVKSEKDTLEVTLNEARSNLDATIDQLKLAKHNEQATQNNLTNVTRRLEEANIQKIDVLEENSELHGKVSTLRKEMEAMRKEMEELRARPEACEVDELKAELAKVGEEKKLLSEQAEAAEGRADLPALVADLTFKLDDVKRTVTEKDKYIGELESQTTNLTKEMEQLRDERAKLTENNTLLHTQSQKSINKRSSQLEKQLVELEKSRLAAQAESDKHLQLLKEQLRRTANDVNKREHPASNLLEKKLNIEEAITEVRLKAERRLAKAENGETDEADAADPETRIAHLEKEIEYHVKDIVLYKLDVKGYRKDLKRAKDKITALTEAANAAEEAATAAAATAAAQNRDSRPSLSSQDSSTSVPQLSPSLANVPSDTESAGPATPSIASALQVQMPVRHIVSAWSPAVSPRATPQAERKAFTAA